jgi:hypothetical protein
MSHSRESIEVVNAVHPPLSVSKSQPIVSGQRNEVTVMSYNRESSSVQKHQQSIMVANAVHPPPSVSKSQPNLSGQRNEVTVMSYNRESSSAQKHQQVLQTLSALPFLIRNIDRFFLAHYPKRYSFDI